MQRLAGGASLHCALPDRLARKAGQTGRAMNSMSADGDREFVDTNVLVYAFDALPG
jgi:hypothetical protein